MQDAECAFPDCGQPPRPPRPRGAPPLFCADHATDKSRRYFVARPKDPSRLPRQTINREGGADWSRSSTRRGDGYEPFAASKWPALIEARQVSNEQAAEALGVSRGTVTQWFAAWKVDRHTDLEKVGWSRKPEVEECLGDSVDAFVKFRDRFFTNPRSQKPWLTEWFHREWIERLYTAYREGGQEAIVAPPRSGKTSLLIAFMCWLIVKHPDIAVIWVAKSAKMAEKSVGMVLAQLESNRKLIDEVLGPGGTFKPAARSGTKWTAGEFVVATRTAPQRSATMIGLGVAGAILGLDADFIVGDDVEDKKSTGQPGMRDKTREWWFGDVDSRKEEHTGWAYIGSRQHPDDLIGAMMRSPEWRIGRVYKAHDPACHHPWTAGAAPLHQGCLLFESVRSFEWLMTKRLKLGSDLMFELNYQNNPRPREMAVFDRADMQACLHREIAVGQTPPWRHRLVAGFDPGGGKGRQSAVLWAVDPQSGRRRLVDLESQEGGGTLHMRSVVARWSDKYPHLKTWVFEDNYLKDTLAVDDELRKLRIEHGLRYEAHHTGSNKWDLKHGVYAMLPLYELQPDGTRLAELPAAGVEAAEKVTRFIDEHCGFTAETSGARWAAFDLVMAAWFPQTVIKLWVRQESVEQEHDPELERSYPWLDEAKDWVAA